MSLKTEVYLKGEVCDDSTIYELIEQTRNGAYLLSFGNDIGDKQWYFYANHSFIRGDYDAIGMSHDGTEYWEITPDSFAELYKEIKEIRKNDGHFMEIVSPRIEKVIREHTEYLEEQIFELLKERFEKDHTSKEDQKEIKFGMFASAPTMDSKEKLVERLIQENEILELLNEQFELEHTPVEGQHNIINETLTNATSKTDRSKMIIGLRLHNNGLRRINEENNK